MSTRTLHNPKSLRLVDTPLAGVKLVELVRREDDRGFFARAWCSEEFTDAGLFTSIAQANIAYNARRGTLRGIHWQAPPHSEAKLLRCIRGAVLAVVLDLRDGSATRGRHEAYRLDDENRRGLYVPAGCALGYQTLADDTELFYLMSHHYVPEAARGVRYDDPTLGIAWPLEVTEISETDRHWPTYEEAIA